MTKEEKSAYDKEYRLKNKDRIAAFEVDRYQRTREQCIEKSRSKRIENPEETARYMREYYSANKEAAYLRVSMYRAANPQARTAERMNRRAKKLGCRESHTTAQVESIFTNQRGLCANCETKLFKSGKRKYHADHVMPLALGGSNGIANIQCLCPTCNLRKSAKPPAQWAKENGRLL